MTTSALMRVGATAMLVLGVSASLSAQVSDTTPPALTGFTFTPTQVDVTGGPQSVVVTATITDDLSGVTGASMQFRSPSGQQLAPVSGVFLSTRISGDALNGTYRGIVQIPRFSEAGTWKVNGLSLFDAAGNSIFVNTATLQARGLPTDLVVLSVADTQAPQVTGVVFDPPILDVSTANQSLVMNLTLTDDVSGVDLTSSAFVEFRATYRSPSGRQRQFVARPDFQLVSGSTLNGTWRASHVFPAHSEAGTWSLESLRLLDFAGNQRFLATANIRALGLNPDFTVVSAVPDLQPPQVTGLTFTPSVFDTSAQSQSVVVTMTITDDSTGVSFAPDSPAASFNHGVEFRSPSGGQVRSSGGFNSFQLVAGTATNGTWRGTLFFPRFSEAGTWSASLINIKDAVGNQVSLTPSQLVAAGFPSQLVIFQPSQTADGSVGTGGGTVLDSVFGSRASVTFPPGAVAASTSVAIDVLSTPLNVPTPAGFSAGTFFVNIDLAPTPSMPFPPPGLTLTLPLSAPRAPGTLISLYRLDPVTGLLVPAVSVTNTNVVGTVLADGITARFTGVSRLSTLVGFVSNAVVGDVNSDSLVNCADVAIVKASFGKRFGQFGFDIRADVNRNAVVDINDLGVVSRQLPAGTTCP